MRWWAVLIPTSPLWTPAEKRRIGMLPKPNWLARVYSREALDKMVGDVQAAVAKPGQRSRAARRIESQKINRDCCASPNA